MMHPSITWLTHKPRKVTQLTYPIPPIPRTLRKVLLHIARSGLPALDFSCLTASSLLHTFFLSLCGGKESDLNGNVDERGFWDVDVLLVLRTMFCSFLWNGSLGNWLCSVGGSLALRSFVAFATEVLRYSSTVGSDQSHRSDEMEAAIQFRFSQTNTTVRYFSDNYSLPFKNWEILMKSKDPELRHVAAS